jgi:hypothetical protein
MTTEPAPEPRRELRDMIEWWLTLPYTDPPYQHRTLEQRQAAAAWALADLMDVYGYRKDPARWWPSFRKPDAP